MAVQQNGLVIYHVPEPHLNEELCLTAVRQNGRALGCIPELMKVKDVCQAAVMQEGLALEFVPAPLRTPELCFTAVRQNAQTVQLKLSPAKTSSDYPHQWIDDVDFLFESKANHGWSYEEWYNEPDFTAEGDLDEEYY